MEYITKPSITRLARRGGVKSVAESCYPVIHDVIGNIITDIVRVALTVNTERSTKTLMVGDIYDAFQLRGYNIAQSTDLSTETCLH